MGSEVAVPICHAGVPIRSGRSIWRGAFPGSILRESDSSESKVKRIHPSGRRGLEHDRDKRLYS